MTWIAPAIAVWFLVLITGSAGYKFNPGLRINAPLITPNNPELR